MRAATLVYHDVIEEGSDFDASGRPGSASATFKLSERDFDAHLDAIRGRVGVPPALVHELGPDGRAGESGDRVPFLLTFDDGGVSAYSVIADRLESRGWRGHFLVASDYVGEPGYLTEGQIRELRRRGHVIGTHSASHPTRMSSLSPGELRSEWSRSSEVLSRILGEPVRVGSVPGGYYSREVAEAAAAEGLGFLFTSEPRLGVEEVAGCLVFGRFPVRRDTDPAVAAGFARGEFWLRVRRSAFWQTKKVAKRIGGDAYLWLRDVLVR